MLSAVSSPSFLEQPCTYSRCVVGYQSHTKTLNSPSVTQLEQGLGRFLTSTVGAEVCKPMKCRLPALVNGDRTVQRKRELQGKAMVNRKYYLSFHLS